MQHCVSDNYFKEIKLKTQTLESRTHSGTQQFQSNNAPKMVKEPPLKDAKQIEIRLPFPWLCRSVSPLKDAIASADMCITAYLFSPHVKLSSSHLTAVQFKVTVLNQQYMVLYFKLHLHQQSLLCNNCFLMLN